MTVSLALTNEPIFESIHVYLNGIEQSQSTEWVYDSATNSIQTTASMGEVSADLLEVRYAYSSGSTPVSGGG